MKDIYEIEFDATKVLRPWIETGDITWLSGEQVGTAKFEVKVPYESSFGENSELKKYKLIVQEQ